MKQFLIEFFSAIAVTWAVVFALGLSGCTFMDQSKAFDVITGKAPVSKSIRMPASLESKNKVG